MSKLTTSLFEQKSARIIQFDMFLLGLSPHHLPRLGFGLIPWKKSKQRGDRVVGTRFFSQWLYEVWKLRACGSRIAEVQNMCFWWWSIIYIYIFFFKRGQCIYIIIHICIGTVFVFIFIDMLILFLYIHNFVDTYYICIYIYRYISIRIYST